MNDTERAFKTGYNLAASRAVNFAPTVVRDWSAARDEAWQRFNNTFLVAKPSPLDTDENIGSLPPHKFALQDRVEIHDKQSAHYGHNGEVIALAFGGLDNSPWYRVKVVTGPRAGIFAEYAETDLRAE